MKNFFKKNKIQLLFTVLGGVGGFLYWKVAGCASGTCPIKSVWYWSTLWGAAMGYLLSDIILGFIKKRRANKGE
jgi:hypothetical protein